MTMMVEHAASVSTVYIDTCVCEFIPCHGSLVFRCYGGAQVDERVEKYITAYML